MKKGKTSDGKLRQSDHDIQIRNLKILIVDDVRIDSIVLAKAILPKIEGIGWKEILYAENGIEAIEAYKRNPDLDLILMNIQMPKMDGYESTRQIRYFNKEVIIIASTETAFEYVREKIKDAGFSDYIRKPIDKSLLQKLIKKFFNNIT